MKKNKDARKKQYLTAVWVVLTGFLLFTGYFALTYIRNNKRSTLHQIIYQMEREANHWKTPQNVPFEENTAEAVFLEGLQLFGEGKYEEAKGLLEVALEKEGKDPALSGYTLFFLNEIHYILTGKGNLQMVEETMEALTYYKPFKEEELWTAALTLAHEPQLREKAVKMLEDYLRINQNLALKDWAGIKNSIAMIEYLSGNYSKSIRGFYDVQLRLETKILTPRLKDELVYAREYIANIYYLFEDYQGAIELYEMLIEEEKERGNVGVFSHYLNLSTAYLETGEIEKAKTTIKELEFLLPDLNPAMQAEIKGSVLEVLASISMEEKDYPKAGEYLEEAVVLYEEKGETVFFGGWYFVELTYCRYLLQEGNIQQVIRRLEKLCQEGYAALYGIEREVYELLLESYKKTGNLEKQITIYQEQLEMELARQANIKKEYLNFSKYYRDANRLQNTNVRLSKTNSFSILVISFSIIAYMVIFYFIRRIRGKEFPRQETDMHGKARERSGESPG